MMTLKASCLMLLTKDNRIVLQKRTNSTEVYFSGCWGPIGGGAGSNESPYECIIRECIEETGWRPKFLQEMFIVSEHCCETVFFSRIEDIANINCYEGEKIEAFTYSQTLNLNISDYHRRITDEFFRIYENKGKNCPKVLLYSKVLLPAFGGYISAADNLIRVIGKVSELTVVTDETINDCFDNQYDLLIFNATYENSGVFERICEQCKQVWTYEHNIVLAEYRNEMEKRLRKASRILVASSMLKKSIEGTFKENSFVGLTVVPLPINHKLFAFSPNKVDKVVRFVTFCAIKPVRRLEANIAVIHKLVNSGIDCVYDIYGEVPYMGDNSYYESICTMIKDYHLEGRVCFKGGIHSASMVYEKMNQYDFYIDFAKHETYGQAKLEALFSGLYVFMPNVGNNSSLLADQNWLVDENVDTAALQIFEIVKECQADSEKDMSWRIKNREHVSRYFSDIVCKDYLEKMLYELI